MVEIKTPAYDATDAAVQKLNELQVGVASGWADAHPYTCAHRGDGRHSKEGGNLGILIATREGLVCPSCGYRQALPAVLPEAGHDIVRLLGLKEADVRASLRQSVERLIEAYGLLAERLGVLAADQTEAQRRSAKEAGAAISVMLQCLHRRRLSLLGVEVRPGAQPALDTSWRLFSDWAVRAGERVEVLCYRDPAYIENRRHEACGHGHWIVEVEAAKVADCDPTMLKPFLGGAHEMVAWRATAPRA